jgi:hypothetical protein
LALLHPDIVEDRLRFVLSTVNEWLKFAEGKNAALFAANVALALVIAEFVINEYISMEWIYLYLYIAMFSLSISASCCLLSFIPQIRLPKIKLTKSPQSNHNLLFYGHIAGYNAEEYLSQFYNVNGIGFDNLPPIHKSYAEQIIINSRITLRKYQWFNLALWFTIFAILSVPGIFILVLW